MKKFILFTLILSGVFLNGYSKTDNLRAYLSYSTFYSPNHGPYLETYLSVFGKSVVYIKKENGKYQASVLVTMLFKQKDSIRDFRKYELFSPEIDDTTSINFSFLDQQRIPISQGTYNFELLVSDKNRDKAPFKIEEQLDINYPAGKINISGIELVESFKKVEAETELSKSGYEFIPFMDNFYPGSINKLVYYSEIYNTITALPQEEKFAVSISIQSYETGKLISNYLKIKRESPKQVIVAFGEFDIQNLPSGNYNLVVSVRDKENKELATNMLFFQRSNPEAHFDLQSLSNIDVRNSFVSSIQSLDTLREYIRSLYPISSSEEKLFIRSQIKLANLETLQQFFLSFWVSRNNADPSKAWEEYYVQVQAVDKEFHTVNKRGYETDRGRVYLQYGPPNARSQSYDEPRAYPYEIWQYYKLGIQSNRKFVFFARDYASGEFELLHSDAQGEINNPRWEIALHSRDTDRYNSPQQIDRMSEDGYFGKHSDDFYNLPR
ncbi:MAG: GWxTD domain-containing protein [Bacteroidales bacterium]|nr:GWxTD domain-containing protein [Bacteroidales bacterium]